MTTAGQPQLVIVFTIICAVYDCLPMWTIGDLDTRASAIVGSLILDFAVQWVRLAVHIFRSSWFCATSRSAVPVTEQTKVGLHSDPPAEHNKMGHLLLAL